MLMLDYQSRARERGHEFSIDRETFQQLVTSACSYCGRAPAHRNLKGRTPAEVNGVDRVDNTLGYVPGNVVTACKTCNHMKKDMTEAEFKAACMAVVFYGKE